MSEHMIKDLENLSLEESSCFDEQLKDSRNGESDRASLEPNDVSPSNALIHLWRKLPNELKLQVLEELLVVDEPIRVCSQLTIPFHLQTLKCKSPNDVDKLATLLSMLPHHDDSDFEHSLMSIESQHPELYFDVAQLFWEFGGLNAPALAACIQEELFRVFGLSFYQDHTIYADVQPFHVKELSTAALRTFYQKNVFEFESGFIPCVAWLNMIGINSRLIRTIYVEVPMLELFIPEAHNYLATRSRLVEFSFEIGRAQEGFRAGLTCHDGIREQPLGAMTAFRHMLTDGGLHDLKVLELTASPPFLLDWWHGIKLEIPNEQEAGSFNISSPLFTELQRLIAARKDLDVSFKFYVNLSFSPSMWPEQPQSDVDLMLHFEKPIRQMVEELPCEVSVVCYRYGPWGDPVEGDEEAEVEEEEELEDEEDEELEDEEEEEDSQSESSYQSLSGVWELDEFYEEMRGSE